VRNTTFITIALAGALLAGCGGGGSSGSSSTSGPVAARLLPVTGTGASTNFSFDLGTVVGNRYYVTDRSNAAVDVFDTTTLAQVAQIKGTGANAFAGQGADNSVSGPDGINAVGNALYVGDVNSVKIIDPATNTVVKTITVGTQGVRADEGCVDSTHNLYMIATPEASTPYVTLINTQTQAVVANVTFTDPAGNPSAGLEGCEYDPGTDAFYINNDGTTANPHGELTVMPGAAIRAIGTGQTVNYTALAGMKAYGLGNCDPTGLALGPNTDIAVNCREGTAGAPLEMLIMNRTTGATAATLNAGGGDQLIYSPEQNRYFNAASRWTSNGQSAGGSCVLNGASMCTPRLITVDAGSRTVLAMAKSGNNAHSVAFDPATGYVFVPVSSDAKPSGCLDCTNGSAGVLVYGTQVGF
jgi:YVTN family beta-propeller protein